MGVAAGILFAQSPDGSLEVADTVYRDRWAAMAQVIVAGAGLLAVGISYAQRGREDHVAEYYALLAAAGAGMAFFVTSADLMTLFLSLEWFSIALYVMCAIDVDEEVSLEAGLKYLIVGGFGSAILLFGSALVYGATGEIGFAAIASADAADADARRRPRHGARGALLQGLCGAVPHVDARTCTRARPRRSRPSWPRPRRSPR